MKTVILITVALMLVASAAMADAKWSADYVPGNPAYSGNRVGGENINYPVLIQLDYAGAFTYFGNTCAFQDDYDEACPYTGSISPDVVYSFFACVDGILDITLCGDGSTYDTKLYVYENDISTLVGCNDDSCPGYLSELSDDGSGADPVPVYACNTYYIVVDGYYGDCGDYRIDLTGPPCTMATGETNFSLVKSVYR